MSRVPLEFTFERDLESRDPHALEGRRWAQVSVDELRALRSGLSVAALDAELEQRRKATP